MECISFIAYYLVLTRMSTNVHELFKNSIYEKFVIIHGHSCEKTKTMNYSD